jgi:alpha-N-arabinofuranosidase
MTALVVWAGLFACAALARGQSVGTLTVDVAHPGIVISPQLYGLMTEEINHSYDGGLYAELIQNRIFRDDPAVPIAWSVASVANASGSIALEHGSPVNSTALDTSLRLDFAPLDAGQSVGVANEGFWGIPVWPNTRYTLSFYARASAGFGNPLLTELRSDDGTTICRGIPVEGVGTQWRRYTTTLTTGSVEASKSNRLVISVAGPAGRGSIWFGLVSLMPPTFHDRPNGNRVDLMQKLADLKPAFLRFPGGNYLEGDRIEDRFDWKKTLGGLETRPGHRGPWGYRSSDGMGLLEFLEWCEDLKMEPLLSVFAGYALHGEHIEPGPTLAPYVQDALDEIEYATGDQTTHWGQERIRNGHRAPFVIHYVEIGNEDGFDRARSYDARFAQFYDELKAHYPQINLIATAPVHSRRPDMIDDHYYRSARSMERDVGHYDNYDRQGTKIFVGEWATEDGRPTPTMRAAVADAAWLTGLERNSDVVLMSAYAPLLVNVDPRARQWPTNLIGYDAVSSFGSPTYYALKMFAQNRGDRLLPAAIALPTDTTQMVLANSGAVGLGASAINAEFADVLVQHGKTVLYQTNFSAGAADWKLRGPGWHATDGRLRHTATSGPSRAIVGSGDWTDYNFSFKVRELGAGPGIWAVFHYQDSENFCCWRLGTSKGDVAELDQFVDGVSQRIGPAVPLKLEIRKWYSVRIEVSAPHVRCYVDDKQMVDALEPLPAPVPRICATASRVESGGAIIVKVVNIQPIAQTMRTDLQGLGNAAIASATIQTLAGLPGDVNSIREPEKVMPRQEEIVDFAGSGLIHEFPANSVSVLRFDVK